ncbi:hypothetical protein BJP50_29350 [Paenibacillus odorifer]|nr:hypothetical protein BJP50_29350 [Paenibacillus odorifer]
MPIKFRRIIFPILGLILLIAFSKWFINNTYQAGELFGDSATWFTMKATDLFSNFASIFKIEVKF